LRALPSALLAIAAGLRLGLGMVVLGVMRLYQYGLALFFGTPLGIGALNRPPRSLPLTPARDTFSPATFSPPP
jgi:hypothetical protein